MLEGTGKIRRRRGREGLLLSRHRVDEGQLVRVQRLPRQALEQVYCEATLALAKAQLLFGAPTVHRIPHDRVAEVREMNADLMGTTGLEPRVDPGHRAE